MNTLQANPSIIFTMGPSTLDEKVLREILSLEVSYVRFNMSHGTHDEHLERLKEVRRISQELNKDIKVFVDLCGPKIRVQKMSSSTMILDEGDSVKIRYSTSIFPLKENSVTISFSDLYHYVKPGTKIALDDGKILLLVSHIDGKDIICNVSRGGELLPEKGVNVIDTDIPIAAFTDKDKRDALFALTHNFDAIALSFVKRRGDVDLLREFLSSNTTKKIPIIAKIETRQALHAIQDILCVADMIMVARGDLGIEIPVEKIPIVQKELVFLARSKGVPAIVATEMLKSMTRNPFPTRAEITDCISALIDGASYIMLSDETTTGNYPVEAVKVMSSVIEEFIQNRKKYTQFEKVVQ